MNHPCPAFFYTTTREPCARTLGKDVASFTQLLGQALLLENVRDPIARSSLVVTTLQSSPIFSTTGNQRSLTPGHGLLRVTKSCGLRSSVARAIHKEESACSSDLESRPGRVVSLYEQRQPQSGTIPGYFRFVTLYVTAPII